MDAKNKPWLKTKQSILSEIKNEEIRKIAEQMLAGQEVTSAELTKKDEDGVTAPGYLARLGKLQLTKAVIDNCDTTDVVRQSIIGEHYEIVAQFLNQGPMRSTIKALIQLEQTEFLWDALGVDGLNGDHSMHNVLHEAQRYDLYVPYITSKAAEKDRKAIIRALA